MVYVHGESFEWNSGNAYDASVLSSFGDVVVVTINYRLGVLGFLSVEIQGARGNYGLLDQVAALHWIQENIHEFGGDSRNVTLFGHDYGAACANFLMISPVTRGTFNSLVNI
uniref:Carboxylesterase type B domain-containing protein n=1 Tax=Strigamia maritima TaxID=126957 RepID=T1JPI5_STRMM